MNFATHYSGRRNKNSEIQQKKSRRKERWKAIADVRDKFCLQVHTWSENYQKVYLKCHCNLSRDVNEYTKKYQLCSSKTKSNILIKTDLKNKTFPAPKRKQILAQRHDRLTWTKRPTCTSGVDHFSLHRENRVPPCSTRHGVGEGDMGEPAQSCEPGRAASLLAWQCGSVGRGETFPRLRLPAPSALPLVLHLEQTRELTLPLTSCSARESRPSLHQGSTVEMNLLAEVCVTGLERGRVGQLATPSSSAKWWWGQGQNVLPACLCLL